MFRLRKRAPNDRSILPRLPADSFIVTRHCGAHRPCGGRYPGFGDIQVVLDESGTASNFQIGHVTAACAHAQLLAVYIPIR